MRNCCNQNCRQGRDCPRRVEKDTPLVAICAALFSVACIASPFAYMLLGGPHA